ncbi:MAG: hypothetical protein IPF58_08675 [Saprospirales bacterium]|nr:hypothetical protein [Saprospirales bacterium]
MKTQTILTLILAFTLITSCKNKTSNDAETKYYELSIKDPNGITLPFTVNNNALLAGFIDSVQYGLTFSDGPNESVITKLYRLDYAVNESAKVMQITKIIAAVDTISLNASKKMNGGNSQFFDVNLTNVAFKKNDNGWNECGQTGVCCSIGQDNKIVCCGSCNPIPDNCKGCGLKNPFNTPLIMALPENEPTLNELFRNYNTLTVKLK